jgi:ribosomal protein S12 methylthiotransferase
MDRLMTMQEDISLGRQALFVGHEFDVVIDSAARDGVAEGRSFREAPEVDGVIEIRDAREELRPGDRIKALVTDAFEHDMAAREVA